MAHRWCFLMLTLGVCGLSPSVQRQFHVVKEEKNWTEAQQYCREEFTDLATIDNMADIDEIKTVIQDAGVGEGWEAWIGLRQGKWQWSLSDEGFYGENETEFRNWGTGQPSGNVDCVDFHQGGKWYGHYCTGSRRFICYNGPSASQPYVLVEEKTWTDAQRYCRENYRDLASVRNQAENDKINDLISRTGNDFFWIGLFREACEWSDGSSSSFRHWAPGEPNNGDANHQYCARMKSSGLWGDVGCHLQADFICYEALPTVEVVSPQSPLYSGDDVTLSCDIPKYTGQHQYVWLKDNSTVPGKTNQTITITLPLEAGQYQCYRRRDGSSVEPYISTPVNITFNDLPTAAVEVASPQSPFYSGDDVTLSCDIPEYSDWHHYVWLKDNIPVPGKTNQTITITLPLEAGQYQCSGQRNDRPTTSSVSSSVNITVNAPSVVILSPPPPFNSGDVVTLRCDIPESTSGQRVQYVWRKDSELLPGDTTRTITVTNPGSFQCHKKREGSSVEPYISRPLEITFTPRLSQVVRVKMQLPPGVNVEDEAVQNAFLQQIGDKLKANGLAADAKLSWKKQPDGKVLHKEKSGKKKKRDEL